MLKVVLLGVAVDENIIEVDHKKLTHVWAEDFRHKTHESCWGIGQAKRHDQELIMPIPSVERCLIHILIFDPQLMLIGPQVNLKKHVGFL